MEIKRFLFADENGKFDGDVLAPSEQFARYLYAALWSSPFSAMFHTVKEDGFGAYYIYDGTERDFAEEVEMQGRTPCGVYVHDWLHMLQKNPRITDFVDSDALDEMAPLSARREVEDEQAEAARAPKDPYALNGVSRRDFC